MKKFIICIIGIGLPIYLLPFMLRGDLDRFNPIAEEKNVYAVAEGYGIPDYHYKGRAIYSLKSVDELSNVKGKYVYSYEAISKEDIPEKIRGQLKLVDK